MWKYYFIEINDFGSKFCQKLADFDVVFYAISVSLVKLKKGSYAVVLPYDKRIIGRFSIEEF